MYKNIAEGPELHILRSPNNNCAINVNRVCVLVRERSEEASRLDALVV